nr:competence type IV pilus assembly protein ComGB [Lactococcus insecticola]
MDISVLIRRKQRKLPIKKQVQLIKLMTNLFSSGFHLAEIINFLERSNLVEDQFVIAMRTGLENGRNLAQILADLHFSPSVVTQIALADFHGNTQQTLALVQENLTKMQKVRQKLISVATYPVILLGFLMLIMLGLKTYLLPQVDGTNAAGVLINYLPWIFLTSVATLAVIVGVIRRYFKKSSPLKIFQKMGQMPVLKHYLRLYFTAFYAREWGNLIKQGLELRQILGIMQDQGNRLFKEIGEDVAKAMQRGGQFQNKVASYHFFTPELALIIAYGEMKSKLGDELLVYSDEVWLQFFEKIERAMNLIQPLIFLFVALMIVLIYAAMLLPIYSQMDMAV